MLVVVARIVGRVLCLARSVMRVIVVVCTRQLCDGFFEDIHILHVSVVWRFLNVVELVSVVSRHAMTDDRVL